MGILEDFIAEFEKTRFHDWEEVQRLASVSRNYLDYVRQQNFVIADLRRQVDNGYKAQSYLDKKIEEMEIRVHEIHKDVIAAAQGLHLRLESDKSVSKEEREKFDTEVNKLMDSYLR